MSRGGSKKSGSHFSRRDFFKLGQLAGVSAVGGALAATGLSTAPEEKRKGTCRLCTMHCGIVATIQVGQLVRVDGDVKSKTRGFICHHAYGLRELVHADDRVRTPLVRSAGKLERTSWTHAFEAIALRMNTIKERYGARAIAVQTGWPFVRHPLVGVLQRFCHAFGTPNLATVASLCEASGRMGRSLTLGSKSTPDVWRTRTLILWGANPDFSAPPFAQQIGALPLRNKNLIVIDPVRTDLAKKATVFLQVRPGTDGALALGLIHVIVKSGAYDAKFVDEHTVGFSELCALVEEYSPPRVAQLTGVPATDIERAAQLFAQQGPGAIWDGLGIEHHENGVQTVRAVAALEAICGYVDQKGGSILERRADAKFADQPLAALYRMRTQNPVPPPVEDRPIGYDEYPLFEIYNRQAQGNLFARAIMEEKPYPLRGLILIGSNPFVTGPAGALLRRAAKKLDLLVSIDPFLTASGKLADFVLPAGTFAESAAIAPNLSVEHSEIAQPLMAPQHEALPDWKIIFELARALGLGKYFPWHDLAEALSVPHVPYMEDRDHTLYYEATLASSPRFPTSSGKIELVSKTLERFGHDALPAWRAPTARPTAEFPLLLVTGPRTRAYINSQFRTVASITRKNPHPEVLLHPATAARFSVTNGARVRIVSPSGQVEMVARLSADIHLEVAVVPSGWQSASANELTDTAQLDPISGFPVFRSLIGRIEPS